MSRLDGLIAQDERLRIVATDPVALRRAVESLRAESDGLAPGPRRMSLLRMVGSGLTALGDYDAAGQVLEEALDLACQLGDPRAEVAARINLGDALRYADDLDAARTHYESALRLARQSVPDRVDFALQHLGKYHIDAGQGGQAVACLREALQLRQAKGDPDLIRSTVDALALAMGS